MDIFAWLASIIFSSANPTPNIPKTQTQNLSSEFRTQTEDGKLYVCRPDLSDAGVIRPTGFKSLQLGTLMCSMEVTAEQTPTTIPTDTPYPGQPTNTPPPPTPTMFPGQPSSTPIPASPIPTRTPSPTPASSDCTYTQGFWKTHPERWPVEEMEIGTGFCPPDNICSKDRIISGIMNQESLGIVWYILGKQYVAAKLNILKGNTLNSTISGLLTDGYTWLKEHYPSWEDNMNLTHSERDSGIYIAEQLAFYNQGDWDEGPPHCK